MSQSDAITASRRRIRIHLVVLALYVLLAFALTFPLILHLTTHVPGDGRDDPPLVWNLWWVPYSLLQLHSNPLTCNYMFYPIGINLTYFTLTILNGLLSVPLQAIGGLVLANNLELIGSYVLAAFGTYLLVLDVLSHSNRRSAGYAGNGVYLAACVAGLVYAFAPIKMIFASLGQFNMASTQWIPFFVLYLLRATRPHPQLSRYPQTILAGTRLGRLVAAVAPPEDRNGWRAAVLAALFLLFQAYAEFTFASFLIIFTAVYLAYRLAVRRTMALTASMIGRLSIMGLVFLIGFWPILGSMLREIATEGDYSLSAGWGFADIFAADLLGFFVPSHLHPILGSFAREATRAFSYTNFATVGFAVLLVAVAGLIAHRRQQRTHAAPPVSFWGISALLYAILSLGPVLHIAGRWIFDLDGLQVRVPLLFIILHYVPIIKANRYPSRLQVLVILCLAVLVGYGVSAILNRTRMNAQTTWMSADKGRKPSAIGVHPHPAKAQIVLTVVIASAILFEYLAIPLPLSDMRVPDVYRRIVQDNNNASVLQLPISWRNSFQFIPQSFTALPSHVNTVVMFEQFYQTVHQGPILSGNTSRNPEFKFTYFLEAPVIRTLVALEEGRAVSPEQVAYDRSLIGEVLRFFGFKYIVLHPPLVGGPVEDYVRAVFPVEPIPADPGLSAYRIIAPPPVTRLTIDMGSDMSNLYRAEGWGEAQDVNGRRARWSDRPEARLMLPLTAGGPVTLSMDVAGSVQDSPVEIRLNGHTLSRQESGSLPQTLRLMVPAGVTRTGLNDLVVRVSRLRALPASEGAEPYRIGTTGVQTYANIVVHSAGLDAGGDLGFAHIYINGKDVISGRRGFNVAVIDASTGRVEQTARFDLLGNPAANGRFLDFVKAVPDGKIVAVAVMDDASINFSEQSAQALRLIGAQADLTGRLRQSYAAIGVKGATPGQALEQWAQGRPASVAVGAHVFGKGLGIALSRVTVSSER